MFFWRSLVQVQVTYSLWTSGHQCVLGFLSKTKLKIAQCTLPGSCRTKSIKQNWDLNRFSIITVATTAETSVVGVKTFWFLMVVNLCDKYNNDKKKKLKYWASQSNFLISLNDFIRPEGSSDRLTPIHSIVCLLSPVHLPIYGALPDTRSSSGSGFPRPIPEDTQVPRNDPQIFHNELVDGFFPNFPLFLDFCWGCFVVTSSIKFSGREIRWFQLNQIVRGKM